MLGLAIKNNDLSNIDKKFIIPSRFLLLNAIKSGHHDMVRTFSYKCDLLYVYENITDVKMLELLYSLYPKLDIFYDHPSCEIIDYVMNNGIFDQTKFQVNASEVLYMKKKYDYLPEDFYRISNGSPEEIRELIDLGVKPYIHLYMDVFNEDLELFDLFNGEGNNLIHMYSFLKCANAKVLKHVKDKLPELKFKYPIVIEDYDKWVALKDFIKNKYGVVKTTNIKILQETNQYDDGYLIQNGNMDVIHFIDMCLYGNATIKLPIKSMEVLKYIMSSEKLNCHFVATSCRCPQDYDMIKMTNAECDINYIQNFDITVIDELFPNLQPGITFNWFADHIIRHLHNKGVEMKSSGILSKIIDVGDMNYINFAINELGNNPIDKTIFNSCLHFNKRVDELILFGNKLTNDAITDFNKSVGIDVIKRFDCSDPALFDHVCRYCDVDVFEYILTFGHTVSDKNIDDILKNNYNYRILSKINLDTSIDYIKRVIKWHMVYCNTYDTIKELVKLGCNPSAMFNTLYKPNKEQIIEIVEMTDWDIGEDLFSIKPITSLILYKRDNIVICKGILYNKSDKTDQECWNMYDEDTKDLKTNYRKKPII